MNNFLENLQLPLIFVAGIALVCSLLDAFLFTPNTLGLLSYIPWGLAAFLGAILVGGAIYNQITKK